MKLIINCSTLSGTGVTQVAISFIYECLNHFNNEYHVFISSSVKKQLDLINFSDNFFFYEFESHPLYGLKGFKVRYEIKRLEKIIQPNCVFTVFGPSWVKFRSVSYFGYAYPHYVYPESPYFKLASLRTLVRLNIYKWIHKYFLLRDGDYFICETQDVSDRFSKIFNVPNKHVFTVGNTYSSHFDSIVSNSQSRILPLNSNQQEFRFLCLFSFQEHKNFYCIKRTIRYFIEHKLEYKVKFVLTIDDKNFKNFFSSDEQYYIINVGHINVNDCPQLYSECFATFVPTLLECFTANYPESMKMGLPILTSDLPFSRGICGDGAIYFDPEDISNIYIKILKLINDQEFRNELILRASNQLTKFETASSRADKYLKILENGIHV